MTVILQAPVKRRTPGLKFKRMAKREGKHAAYRAAETLKLHKAKASEQQP